MNIFERDGWCSKFRLSRLILTSLAVLFAICPQRSSGVSRCTSPGGGRSDPAASCATDSRAVATTGRTDCTVSGFASSADSGGVHVSRASRRGRTMAASTPRFAGRRFGSSRGPATLGSERQGAHCISIRPWKHGQEPSLDLITGRRLLQSARGRDECRSSDAPAGAGSGQSADHASANGGDAGLDD